MLWLHCILMPHIAVCTNHDLFQSCEFLHVIRIDVRLQINAPKKIVWDVISNIDYDPCYWWGISSIGKTSQDRIFVRREINLINGAKCHQKVTLFPREGIHIKWTRGPITGIKDLLLTCSGNATILQVQMNYTLSGPVQLVSKDIVEELRFEAEQALRLIKEEAEKKFEEIVIREGKLQADLINGQ